MLKLIHFLWLSKKSCPSTCKTEGGYFKDLDGENIKVLNKVAQLGSFSENVEFLIQFNTYMEGNMTAKELYSFLDGLNLDDCQYHKYLIKCKENDQLDNMDNAAEVKQAYQEVADTIQGMLFFNLHSKSSTIRDALWASKGLDY
ncbi:Uncharacterised protein [Legionella hackeliae]|nr:Uncharacterised protein [Legionella hackeliae]